MILNKICYIIILISRKVVRFVPINNKATLGWMQLAIHAPAANHLGPLLLTWFNFNSSMDK